ncbi:hypothetical protein BKA63DRAFT_554538 [Paraphoma chrysanthemicola]|nr:hypothetical protein BKA63DRAFT_554538 [Paraphoma chrysanthemicola]
MSKKSGSQQQDNSWSKRLLDPIGNWLINRATSRNENNLRQIRQYLNEINPDSCLILFTKILLQLLDGTKDVDSIFKSNATTDRSGKRVWKRDNFAGFLQSRLPGNAAVTASIPILWCTFCSAAVFPFSLQSNNPDLDMDDFRRAFVLVVTRGYELLGAKSDGSPSDRRGSIESYADKVPRLARIIFRSLSTPWVQSATPARNSHKSLQLQDIKDTISFTRPIIPQEIFIQPLREANEEWDAAARRVQLADHKQPGSSESPIAISKANFQRLVQLLFLQRVEDRCWRAGYNFYSFQRSGDIVYSGLSSDPDEISRAANLASAFTAHQFPSGEDYITLEQFQVCCTERPYYLFAFFQLWATLFTTTTELPARWTERNHSLSVCITNVLSFLNVSHMNSGLGPNNRYHANEHGFQLDLQAVKLVASVASTPELSVMDLHSIIAQRSSFHIVLIRGEGLDPESDSSSRLIVAFTSPPEEEMWRWVEGKRFVQYAWRTSMVQLEPSIAVANTGGMSATIQGQELELRSHRLSGKHSTSMRVDLAKRVVNLEGFATGAMESTATESGVELPEVRTTSAIRLIGMECYCMPGRSSKVTSSGGEKPFWQE